MFEFNVGWGDGSSDPMRSNYFKALAFDVISLSQPLSFLSLWFLLVFYFSLSWFMSTTSTRVLPSEEPIKDPWNDIAICFLSIAMTKSKDDDNIHYNDDNGENNVVGLTKRQWNANNFSKNWAQKTWYQNIA